MAFVRSSNLLSIGTGGLVTLAAGSSVLSQVSGGAPILDVSSNVPINVILSGVIAGGGVALAINGNKTAGVFGVVAIALALANGNVKFNGSQAARFGSGVYAGMQNAAAATASATQQGVKSTSNTHSTNSSGVSFDGWVRVRPLSAGEIEGCNSGAKWTTSEKGVRNCSSGYVWKAAK